MGARRARIEITALGNPKRKKSGEPGSVSFCIKNNREDQSLLVDLGSGIPVPYKRDKTVVISHHHPDHYPGANMLADFSSVFLNTATIPLLKSLGDSVEKEKSVVLFDSSKREPITIAGFTIIPFPVSHCED